MIYWLFSNGGIISNIATLHCDRQKSIWIIINAFFSWKMHWFVAHLDYTYPPVLITSSWDRSTFWSYTPTTYHWGNSLAAMTIGRHVLCIVSWHIWMIIYWNNLQETFYWEQATTDWGNKSIGAKNLSTHSDIHLSSCLRKSKQQSCTPPERSWEVCLVAVADSGGKIVVPCIFPVTGEVTAPHGFLVIGSLP